MSGQDERMRGEAERLWSARQRFAAVERDREQAREEWRDTQLLRQQMGPMVAFSVVFALFIAWLIAGRAELLIALIAAGAFMAAGVLIVRHATRR